MKVNILYKCKICGQVFIGKTVDYKNDNVNLNSTLIGYLKYCPILPHECEENIKCGIAELISIEKV